MDSLHNDQIIATLQKQLEESRNDLRNYKYLYRNELAENSKNVKTIKDYDEVNQRLLREKSELDDKISNLQEHMNAMKIPKGYKKYHQLKSPTAKARRRAQFKRCLNQSIAHLHEIKNAQVKLIIGDKDVNLSWCENDLRELRNGLRQLNEAADDPNLDAQNNRPFAGDEDFEDAERITGAHAPDPFLPDGKWNTQHIQRIIHVLDMFGISHEAYHELRLTSRSILPPVYTIKREKKTMSKRIHYYKRLNVRKRLLFPMLKFFPKKQIDFILC